MTNGAIADEKKAAIDRLKQELAHAKLQVKALEMTLLAEGAPQESEFGSPPIAPAGAKTMNQELSRRLRSFLEGREWWEIIQLRRAQTSTGHAAAVLAGIVGLSNEDKIFAHSVDWNVSRDKVEFANVSNYAVGDWTYAGQNKANPDQLVEDYLLGVWGWVDIRLNTPKDEAHAKKQAKGFAKAVLSGANTSPKFQDDGIEAEPKDLVDGKATLFRVIGQIYV